MEGHIFTERGIYMPLDMKKEIEKIVEEHADTYCQNGVKSTFNSERLFIYTFVSKNNSDIPEMLKKHIENTFVNPNAEYISIISDNVSGQNHYDSFIAKLNEIEENGYVDVVNSIAFIPVFIQSGTDTDLGTSFGEFKVFYDLAVGMLNRKMGCTFCVYPVALLESDDKKIRDNFMKKIFEWQSDDMTILVLFHNNARGFKDSKQSIVHTICYTSILLASCNINHVGTENGSSCCFTSRIVSIKLPYHVGILICAIDLLNFFTGTSDDNDDTKKRLGKSISELLLDRLWKNYKEALPVDQMRNIHLEPVYSLTFPKNATNTDIREIYDRFAEKYYLSALPVECSDDYIELMVDGFYDKCKESFEKKIDGFNYLFENVRQVTEFIDTYVDDMPIAPLPKTKNVFVAGLSEKLYHKIQKRMKDFFKNFFDHEMEWYDNANRQYTSTKEYLRKLKNELENMIKHWKRIEGSIPYPISFNWETDENIEKLFDSYTNILKSSSDQLDEQFRIFINALFKTASTNFPLSSEYIINFNSAFIEKKIPDQKIDDWSNLLLLPNIVNLEGDRIDEYHCICSEDMFSRCDFIKNIINQCINRTLGTSVEANNITHWNINVDDTVEIVHISSPGKWNFNDMNEIGKEIGNEGT